jgi:hypothetical protein
LNPQQCDAIFAGGAQCELPQGHDGLHGFAEGDETGCVEPYPEHDYRDQGGGIFRCSRCDAEIWEDESA